MRVIVSLALATALAAPLSARAQSVDQRAEELNAEGKRLFGEQKLEEALLKFRQAVVISPQGKYYFNVCFTLAQLGRYNDAVIACEAVVPNGADEELEGKTTSLLAKLREQIAAQGGESTGGGDTPPVDPGTDPGVDPGGPIDPGVDPGETGPGVAPPSGPPLMDLQQQGPPPIHHDYQWGLGFELYGLNNVSIGGSLIDGDDRYGDGGFQFRGFGNLLLDHQRRIGAQAYIGYSLLPDDAIASAITESPLALIDVGVAAFWHLPLTRSFYLTPLIGAHLSLQGPADQPETFVAVGGRGDLAFDWVLGSAGIHVLSVKAGVNVYSRAGGNSNGFLAEDFGLDSGGMTAVFGVGYTLRFDTPLGRFPIITLE